MIRLRLSYVPLSVATVNTSSFFADSAAACFTVTLFFLTKRSRADTMSAALSLTGKTRLPRSVFRGTPSPSKNAIVSSLSKEE